MRAKDICADDNLTKEEKWELLIGTDYYGNLPQYKVNEHVGHIYAPCPYDIGATDIRTRHLLGLTTSGILPTKVSHIGSNNKNYYMATSHHGGWGYICTYSGCTHLLNEGQPFFYK